MPGPYDARLTIGGTGAPVVFVPGIHGGPQLFYRQRPLLEPSFTVATYGYRNDAASHDVLADDLAAIIDAVAPLERCAIVVAESFGGAVALTCALRQPGKVRALVTINSFPFFRSRVRLGLAVAGTTIVPWKAMPLLRRITDSRLHSPSTLREDRRRHDEAASRITRDAYLNRLRLVQKLDLRKRLGEIRQPALFLASEHDHVLPSVDWARYMSARVPASGMRILKGHGHACLLAPDFDLAAILHDWAATASAACRRC